MGLVVAGIVGAAAAAASTGYALSGAGQPSYPDLASSSAEMVQTQARLLPYQRAIEAAAEEGIPYEPGPGSPFGDTSVERTRQVVQVPRTNAQGGRESGFDTVPYVESEWQPGGKYANLGAPKIQTQTYTETVPRTLDFTGYGQADIQGKLLRQMAQSELDQARKYDPAFIASALAQESAADPQGVAARAKLDELIKQQEQNVPVSPVAQEIQRQVTQRVAAGQKLTPQESALLNQAVTSAGGARGGASPAADFAVDPTTGFSGERRAQQNAAAGLGWLASGQTPEDIAYRAEQQNLANLGAEVAGKTPEAQFRELSGAQAGPTPVVGGQTQLSTLSPGAGPLGASSAVTGYNAAVSSALNQANPWMAGLTGLLGLAGTAGAAGWKPLGG